MTVLINSYVDFKPEDAATALADATQLMADTRDQKGCRAYVWSQDPTTAGRVYVYENWESVEDLAAILSINSRAVYFTSEEKNKKVLVAL